MFEQISSVLLERGLLGIACLILGGVSWHLYKKLEKQETKLQADADICLALNQVITEKLKQVELDLAKLQGRVAGRDEITNHLKEILGVKKNEFN